MKKKDNLICPPSQTHEKIIRLYITMKIRLRMDELETIYLTQGVKQVRETQH